MLDDLKKETGQFKENILKIEKYMGIGKKKGRVKELEPLAQSSDLWKDPNKAKVVLQEIKALEKIVQSYETLKTTFDDLEGLVEISSDQEENELRKEFEDIKKKASVLELAALLSGPYDSNNAILSINSGAGGTDSQDWAQILLRMYTRWAEHKGYALEMPDISYGEEAGIKSATLIISGPYAYGYLKNETGIHRLVRISPFSSEGKRHTSFASVEVVPEITEDINIEIDPADLRVDTYRASGPGGQNVNKVSSAIRITHIPTGIVTQSQTDRSQHKNRDNAMRILKAKLYEMMQAQHKEKIDELRGEKKAIEWGHQIRSYVFQPYTLVKDHRTGAEVGNVDAVVDGDIDAFIEASLKKKG
ncbi:peptide chain release factor 2 [Candidatus Saganbacteria bacterium]|nr:peptide chain release factor 2 [Candidatus Saganbacteria bacterium]